MPARDPQTPSALTRMAPAVLLATLLLLTAAATWAAADRVHDRQREQLTDDAQDAVAAIDRRMDDYGQVLRGAAGLYAASNTVSYREFHDYFADQDIARRFPGVQVIGSASYVPRAGIPDYTRRTRAAIKASRLKGYGPFRPYPKLTAGESEALIVDHLEPPPGNGRAFGLNFLSEPRRRTAALLARRTGDPASTAPIALVQTGGQSLGIDLFVPVYSGPPRSGEPRRWAGVVYAAFRIDNLLRGILGPMGDARVEVYDLGSAAKVPPGTPITRRAVAFDLRPDHRDKNINNSNHTRVETLEVAGRRWAVAYTRPGSSLSSGERAVPWLIAIAGVLVSLLAAALLRTLATSRRRAVALAQEMTGELREREEQLKASNEELEHFAYLASHDLQEPLRTITSYTGLLGSRAGDALDDRAKSWLGFVSDAAERMSHLISDLLEYSRTGSAGDEREPAAVALDDAWDLAVANLRHAIDDAGATVQRSELPVVRARPREMTSMLQNLIGNGLKYRRDGIAPVVRASAARDGNGGWELTISDNGIGIEPHHRERVFGLFQRLHTAEEYPGTGMGLAIVKKIVEANGGAVRVESTPGEGSTFIVTLQGETRT
jgi:signal transduction histidine kinase